MTHLSRQEKLKTFSWEERKKEQEETGKGLTPEGLPQGKKQGSGGLPSIRQGPVGSWGLCCLRLSSRQGTHVPPLQQRAFKLCKGSRAFELSCYSEFLSLFG